MPKPSMKNALDASLSAETAAFQARLSKADAHAEKINSTPKESELEASAIAEAEGKTEIAPVPKVLREAFTIPENEHGQIEAIRAAMLSQALAVSKSEVLRAGLMLLFEADDNARRAVLDRLERVKTGRPKMV